jgi:hypothetical protein
MSPDAAADAGSGFDGATPVDASNAIDGTSPVDAAPSCAVGQTTCSGQCVDTTSSHDNCGACGTKCTQTQACLSGACVATCSASQTVCAGACVTVATDNANCGACGATCPRGQVCSNGACSTSCASNLTTCNGNGNGDAGVDYCANVSTDNANCGACGVGCAAGQSCLSGACAATCGTGSSSCPAAGDGGVGYCANFATDNHNCGGCGAICGSGEACESGHCTTTCGAGQAMCATDGGAYCATLSTDNANCGACGAACSNGDACRSGSCTATCGQGLALCETDAGGYCSNLQSDPSNCGTCGHGCTTGEFCSSGSCGTACATGTTACASNGATVCATLATDGKNCGACGAICGVGASCTSGQCVYPQASCSDLLAANAALTDGVYLLTTAGGVAFSAYCDMTNGGYTLLLAATAGGTAWGNSSGTWSSNGSFGTTPATVGSSLSADYKSLAYGSVVTNDVRLCYRDTTHCHVFAHGFALTLLQFFQQDVTYTEYSSDTTNYPNTGDDSMRMNFLTQLGFSTDGAGMLSFWMGINQVNTDATVPSVVTGFSAIGVLGDINCGAQDFFDDVVDNNCQSNNWDDDYALGLGVQSCSDGNGCDPGQNANNLNGTTQSISGAPSTAGPWYVFGR